MTFAVDHPPLKLQPLRYLLRSRSASSSSKFPAAMATPWPAAFESHPTASSRSTAVPSPIQRQTPSEFACMQTHLSKSDRTAKPNTRYDTWKAEIAGDLRHTRVREELEGRTQQKELTAPEPEPEPELAVEGVCKSAGRVRVQASAAGGGRRNAPPWRCLAPPHPAGASRPSLCQHAYPHRSCGRSPSSEWPRSSPDLPALCNTRPCLLRLL